VTLPTFDADLHHVGLGEAGETQYGFTLQGAYRKSLQNRPTPQEYGGSNDLLSSPILSRWTQDDFSGGSFRKIWGADSAMFALSSGMFPRRQDVTARTVPPIAAVEAGYAQGPLTNRDLIAVGTYLYVFDTALRRFDTTSENFDVTTALASACRAVCYEPGERVFYVLVGTDGALYRYTEAGVAHTTASYANGTGGTAIINHIIDLGTYLVGIDSESYVWSIALNTNRATAPVWTRVGRLTGSTIAVMVYNGQVYVLTGGGLGRAKLSSFDGTNILPILEWPYNFTPVSMTVYGGKIYVAGNVESASGVASYAQLYEVTGSSLRLVRSFEDDLPANTTAGALEVVDGILLMAAKGWGLIGYDLTSDSLWGAHRFSDGLSSLSVQQIAASRDRLYLYGDAGGALTSGLYRAALSGQTVAQYSCYLETSDFGPEPARLKRWSQVHVQSKGGAPTVEYSTDGGETFTTLSVTTTVEGDFRLDAHPVPVHLLRHERRHGAGARRLHGRLPVPGDRQALVAADDQWRRAPAAARRHLARADGGRDRLPAGRVGRQPDGAHVPRPVREHAQREPAPLRGLQAHRRRAAA
jgi:hypothetical protein